MPSSKEYQKRYPGGSLKSKEWLAIRRAILERAQYRCEGSPAYPDCGAEHHQPHPITGKKVELTTAHVDHMPEHNDPANLRAWCQRCHLTFDGKYHAKNAARTRRAKMRTDDLFAPEP